eukprot:1161814-Pelagomonas_calceolata.AAC.14
MSEQGGEQRQQQQQKQRPPPPPPWGLPAQLPPVPQEGAGGSKVNEERAKQQKQQYDAGRGWQR